jgi:hypothetical protein
VCVCVCLQHNATDARLRYQINDYWSQGMVGSEGHGCPEAKVDLWLDEAPARGLNGSAYEEVLFEEHLHAALRTYTASTPGSPQQKGDSLFLHYSPHLVHDPYEVPASWLAKFDFIAKQGDDIKGLRQVYACVYPCGIVQVGCINMLGLFLWLSHDSCSGSELC